MWGPMSAFSKTQYYKATNSGQSAKCKTCIEKGKLEKEEGTLSKFMKEICVDVLGDEPLTQFENKRTEGKVNGVVPPVTYKWKEMGVRIKANLARLERLEDGRLKLCPKKRKLDEEGGEEANEGDEEKVEGEVSEEVSAAGQPVTDAETEDADDEPATKKAKVDEEA